MITAWRTSSINTLISFVLTRKYYSYVRVAILAFSCLVSNIHAIDLEALEKHITSAIRAYTSTPADIVELNKSLDNIVAVLTMEHKHFGDYFATLASLEHKWYKIIIDEDLDIDGEAYDHEMNLWLDKQLSTDPIDTYTRLLLLEIARQEQAMHSFRKSFPNRPLAQVATITERVQNSEFGKNILSKKLYFVPAGRAQLPIGTTHTRNIKLMHDGQRIIYPDTSDASCVRSWKIDPEESTLGSELAQLTFNGIVTECEPSHGALVAFAVHSVEEPEATPFVLYIYEKTDSGWQFRKKILNDRRFQRIAFNPDNKQFATCSEDLIVQLWCLDKPDSIKLLVRATPSRSLCVDTQNRLFTGNIKKVDLQIQLKGQEVYSKFIGWPQAKSGYFDVLGCYKEGTMVIVKHGPGVTINQCDIVSSHTAISVASPIAHAKASIVELPSHARIVVASENPEQTKQPYLGLSIAQHEYTGAEPTPCRFLQVKEFPDCTLSDVTFTPDANIIVLATADGKIRFFNNIIANKPSTIREFIETSHALHNNP